MLRTRDDVSVTVGSSGSGRDGLDKGASRVRIVMFCIVAISHERKRDALRSGMWESIAEELLIAGDKDLTERMYPERNDTADQHRIRAQQYWKSRETTNWACNLRARIQKKHSCFAAVRQQCMEVQGDHQLGRWFESSDPTKHPFFAAVRHRYIYCFREVRPCLASR